MGLHSEKNYKITDSLSIYSKSNRITNGESLRRLSLPRPDNQQRRDLILAEVVAAHANGWVFRSGQWRLSDKA